MSANNQSLLIKHKGKWLAFPDIMAESWSKLNELDIKEAKEFSTADEAWRYLIEQDTEYGISDRLVKDRGKVKIIEKTDEIDQKITKYLYRAMTIRNDVFRPYYEAEQQNDHIIEIIEIAKMIQKEEK